MTSSLADALRGHTNLVRALLLDVQSISAGYGDLIAVRDVSVQVSAGELVAVIGPQRAGKSTTLLAIAGMLKARSGTVFLDGNDVTSWPVVRRITLGMSCVPEGRQVFRRRTVTENLELGTYPLRLSRSERKLGLESTFERFPLLAQNRNVHGRPAQRGPAAGSRHRAGADAATAGSAPGRAFSRACHRVCSDLVLEVVDQLERRERRSSWSSSL